MKTQIRLALADSSPIKIFSVHMKTAAFNFLHAENIFLDFLPSADFK